MIIFLPNDNLCVFESNAVAPRDVHKYEKPAITSHKLSRIIEDMNEISQDDASEDEKRNKDVSRFLQRKLVEKHSRKEHFHEMGQSSVSLFDRRERTFP